MHLGMPECHKPFLGHCDLDLWPSFQELLCPEHISYIIWCRNPKFGLVIPLGMAEWCIPFWVTLTLIWLLASLIGFSCYITANFPQMCLMLDQFLWGHSSCVCDISCFFMFSSEIEIGRSVIYEWGINRLNPQIVTLCFVFRRNIANFFVPWVCLLF